MTTELENRLEKAAEALPTPSEHASAEARRRALGVLPRRPRRRLRIVALAGTAAIAAVLVAVVGPWQGGSPLATERALAALGDAPVVHAVIESEQPSGTVVDLATGAEREQVERIEVWYDEARALLRVRRIVDGRVVFEFLQSPEGTINLGPVPPSIEGFATAYREALASGQARIEGETTVDGRDAILIRFELRVGRGPSRSEEVAVDAQTYRPLRIFSGNAGHSWRVVAIETLERDETQFVMPAPKARGRSQSRSGSGEVLSPEEAATALGRPAVWPGPSVQGLELSGIALIRYTSRWNDGHETPGKELVLHYGSEPVGPTERSLVVTESSDPHDLPTTLAPGELRLHSLGGGYSGEMEIDGVYAVLRSPDREVILAAARAMRPIPGG